MKLAKYGFLLFQSLILSLVMLVSHQVSASSQKGGDELFYKKSFDLGISSGSSGDLTYTEIDLGLNLYFNPYIDFRNAIFGRFASGTQNIFGLDSSVRGVYSLDVSGFGFTTFAGPGVRIPSQGRVTPIAEGGLILKAPGFGIGAGAKVIANSWVTAGAANETQIFFILAGGGEL